MIEQLAEEIKKGRRLTGEDDVSFLLKEELKPLCQAADGLRKYFRGNHADLCTIINGKSGNCSEDCKFCAQCHSVDSEVYGFLSAEELVKDAKEQERKGIRRYSVVTAGRGLFGRDFEKALEAYEQISTQCHISLCASHGLLTSEQFEKLYQKGVRRYHCNLETSRAYFPKICTTHTFDDKVENIKRARKAGLDICSGGLFGMGESWEDRIDLAFSLARLSVRSIPLNMLIPISGTEFEGKEQLSEEEILRIIAIFRFINPEADIRFAAGRLLLKESGKEAFQSGANAAITGDMLTTVGNQTRQDQHMLLKIGYEI